MLQWTTIRANAPFVVQRPRFRATPLWRRHGGKWDGETTGGPWCPWRPWWSSFEAGLCGEAAAASRQVKRGTGGLPSLQLAAVPICRLQGGVVPPVRGTDVWMSSPVVSTEPTWFWGGQWETGQLEDALSPMLVSRLATLWPNPEPEVVILGSRSFFRLYCLSRFQIPAWVYSLSQWSVPPLFMTSNRETKQKHSLTEHCVVVPLVVESLGSPLPTP